MSRRLFALVVLGCVVVSVGPPASSGPTGGKPAQMQAGSVRLDSMGDPLPPAAVLRLGSMRLQQSGSITALAFGKDDKVLFAAADGSPLRAWVPTTGKDVAVAALPAGASPAVAVAPGGRLLALAGSDRTIRVIDLSLGKVVSQWTSPTASCPLLAFTADGATIAWVEPGSAIHLRDWAARRDTRVLKTSTAQVTSLALSGDGKLLATTHADALGIVLWDTRTGKRIRRYCEDQQQGGSFPGVAFSADGRTLVGLLQGKIFTWETDSIEQKLAIEDGNYQFTQFVVSPDSKLVAAVNQNAEIKVYRLEGGKLLHAVETLRQGTTALVFSNDGKTLAVGMPTGRVRLWDLTTGKEKLLGGSWGLAAQTAGFNRSGELVTVAADRITRWSLRSGKAVKHLPLDLTAISDAALSVDGQTVAVVVPEGEVRIFDLVKNVQRCALPGNADEQGPFALSPDGRLAARLSITGEAVAFRLYDAQTGKQRLVHKLDGQSLESTALLFGPDSRTLCTGHHGNLLPVWEVSTGKTRRPCRVPRGLAVMPNIDVKVNGRGGLAVVKEMLVAGWTHAWCFLPDGRSYILARGDRLAQYDRSTGRLVRSFDGGGGDLEAIAVSPDGRWLAAGGDDQAVYLWDLRTGRLIASLAGHRGKMLRLAFAPRGSQLLSVSADGTVLVWDMSKAPLVGTVGAVHRPARPRPVERLWSDLADEDAAVAEQAVEELIAQPTEAVRLLGKRLAPVPPVDPARLARLIQELDSTEVVVRNQASGQLAGLEELARTALEKAAGSPSAEVRRRGKQLLDRLDRGQLSGAQARPVRAVEVLEKVGTPEARRLLGLLARGAADAALTRDAAAALTRLGDEP
jgi:WD40 repeat protein